VAEEDSPAVAKVVLVIACIFNHLKASFCAAHEQEDTPPVDEKRRVESACGHVRVTTHDAVRSPFFRYVV